MTPTVETVDLAGRPFLRWRCPTCDAVNLRPLSGTPWNCHGCGRTDRSVEHEADHLYNVEQRRRA